jgi:sugar phosphate isomerase/epimerase
LWHNQLLGKTLTRPVLILSSELGRDRFWQWLNIQRISMFRNLCPEELGISGRDSEVIELVLSSGFKGLDVDLPALTEQVKSQGFAKATRLMTSARLKFGSFRLPVRFEGTETEYKTDLALLPEQLDVASQLGCTRAVTILEPGSETRPFHENFELYRRKLHEVGDLLSAKSMKLGVGFQAPAACRDQSALQFVQRVDQFMLLLSSVTAPNVGIAFDSWHWQLGGGSLDQLRSLGVAKIVTVTLADCEPGLSAETATLADRRLPSEAGTIDNVGVLKFLAEARYDGPVTPAAGAKQLEGQSRAAIVRDAAAACESVWKAAGISTGAKRVAVGGR